MSKLKKLTERRAEIVNEVKTLRDKAGAEGQSLTAEEVTKFEGLESEFRSVDGEIKLLERMGGINTPSNDETRGEERQSLRPDPDATRKKDKRSKEETQELRNLAFQAWGRKQLGRSLTRRHVEACRALRFDPRVSHIDIRLAPVAPRLRGTELETRAASTLDGETGGFAVPDTFVNSLERAMLWFGGMRQVANVFRTTGGEDIHLPTSDDTGNTGSILGESTVLPDGTDITLDLQTWHAYKYTSGLLKAPVELLEDSAWDWAQFVGESLGERLGRIQNTHFTTGHGASRPSGIVTDSALGKTTAGATAITLSEVLDLIHSVDIAYRTGAQFMMHDNVLLYLRKLVDGNTQYYLSPDVQQGQTQFRLFGYPVVINNDMQSSVATATKTMIFGQLNRYRIRDVRTVRLRRLTERYADYDQEGFVAFLRSDGHLLDAGKNPVKHMLQA